MRPKQGMESCQKYLQAQRKRTKLHSISIAMSGLGRQHPQYSRREESLWWILEQACIWYARKTLILPSWDHEDIEESDDGDASQRRGANKRRSHGICQRIGLIRDSDASWRNTRTSFTRKALRRSWVYQPLDQWSKTTAHQKWQKNQLQYNKLCTSRSPWFINEFLYYAQTYFFIIFIAGFCDRHGKSSNRKKWKYEWGVTGKPVEWTRRNREHK